jgi:hypothetical protein
MSIEAMKQMLEVVEAAIKAGDWKVDGACDPDMAIHALRQAIEQAEKQKPVAFVTGTYAGRFVVKPLNPAMVLPVNMALYTTPQPQREWVGFTDEEISDMWCEVSNTDFVTADTHVFARAIEAKLKQKNGYAEEKNNG